MGIYIKTKQLIFTDKGLNSPYQITVQDSDVLRRHKKFIVVGQLVYVEVLNVITVLNVIKS